MNGMSLNAGTSRVCDQPDRPIGEPDGLSGEGQELREGVSRLNRPGLRVPGSIEFNSVMQGVIDLARSLADARYGALLTFDDSGSVQDVFTSGAGLEQREAAGQVAPSGLSSGPVRPANKRVRILVVDQDSRALRQIRKTLSAAGYSTVVTSDPGEVESLVRGEEPDLILLDLALPDVNGIELMKRIREMTDAPVVFLIDWGAGDCVVKPFSPEELVARIGAVLRLRTASNGGGGHQPYRSGELVIDYDERLVTVGGRPARLTATEYRLAVELSVNSGRTMTQDQLLTRVWGASYSGDSQLLRTFVKRLRRKLGDSARNPAYIFTDPCVGYRMAMPESRHPGYGD